VTPYCKLSDPIKNELKILNTLTITNTHFQKRSKIVNQKINQSANKEKRKLKTSPQRRKEKYHKKTRNRN